MTWKPAPLRDQTRLLMEYLVASTKLQEAQSAMRSAQEALIAALGIDRLAAPRTGRGWIEQAVALRPARLCQP